MIFLLWNILLKVYLALEWVIEFCDEFVIEFNAMPAPVQDELLAQLKVLKRFGPQLGRPQVDTLKESRHANMKELRFNAAYGVWRAAFAFDPNRKAIVLVGGDKSGGSQTRFYHMLIQLADTRFDRHLAALAKEKK